MLYPDLQRGKGRLVWRVGEGFETAVSCVCACVQKHQYPLIDDLSHNLFDFQVKNDMEAKVLCMTTIGRIKLKGGQLDIVKVHSL